MTQAIFTLAFVGKNFFRGIVINKQLAFGKDAAYQLLKGTTYNWRRLLLGLGQRLHSFFSRLTDEDRETVLIINDSSYDRSRSKLIKLLYRVYDHSTRRYLKGFRMLTICWSDSVSCLPLDFSLLRDKRKKEWLAMVSTDTTLTNEDIVRIYGKRWDIEVFFKMAKKHLKLAKEIQCRDLDALIAYTSIVFMRYMFVVYQCRVETDHRTFGDLFYFCCDQVSDISFIEALYRILTLAADQLKNIGNFCEKTASAFFDAIMDTALQCVGLSKNNLIIKPES